MGMRESLDLVDSREEAQRSTAIKESNLNNPDSQ